MLETSTVVMRARAARPLAYRDRRSRVSGVKTCAACKGNLDVRKLDAWFCRDCLDRSRIVDGDELGGEC